jgi:NADH:ubiquinone oxidoreductase subunit 5 (subunit L)/multisubunit Na+/H+ antiporter MnhA subunit
VLVGVGLTALYTFRMVSMVFYGPPARAATPWPRMSASGVALGLLALGTLTTWLLAGSFGRLLAASLPFHSLEWKSTVQVILDVVTAPSTGLGLAASALGLAAWGWRGRLARAASRLGWLIRVAQGEFGFDWLNRRIVLATRAAARAAAATQTGQLSWNVAAIAGSLAIVLAILALGMS